MKNYSARSKNSRDLPNPHFARIATRRSLIGMLAATSAAVFVPFEGLSLTGNEAIQLVENLISEFRNLGKSDISDEKFTEEFEKILEKIW